jgi:hypothetical protein
MKRITVLILMLTMGTFVNSQTLDTVRIVSKAKKFKPNQYILLMFELRDTVDASGKNITLSRSYYFDKKDRMISSVREYHNPRQPERGTQLIYSFANNKLAAVTVIPPKTTCRNCATRYFFSNDTVVSKLENQYTNVNSAFLIQQAHFLQSKIPHDLPWGYFDDEVIVNGKRKKLKKTY